VDRCTCPMTVSIGWKRCILSGETERRISSSVAPGSGIGPEALAGRDFRGLERHSCAASSSTLSLSVVPWHTQGMRSRELTTLPLYQQFPESDETQ